MIIDAHTHIGTILNFDMREADLLSAMEQYAIDFSLLSNIEAIEVDHAQLPLPQHAQHTQISANQKTLDFVTKHPARLGALIWIKPGAEGCTDEFCDFVQTNRTLIYGLKVHPYHTKIAFNDPRMTPYFALAKRLDLPILTHTASDAHSHPKLVGEVAQAWPDISFIMGHIGLGTDHEAALQIMATLPNVYGDTAWVEPSVIATAIARCGEDKLLFGSDNPINGVHTYDDEVFYIPYFTTLQHELTPRQYTKLMSENAQRVYRIHC